jgi:hypothetical protein
LEVVGLAVGGLLITITGGFVVGTGVGLVVVGKGVGLGVVGTCVGFGVVGTCVGLSVVGTADGLGVVGLDVEGAPVGFDVVGDGVTDADVRVVGTCVCVGLDVGGTTGLSVVVVGFSVPFGVGLVGGLFSRLTGVVSLMISSILPA